MLAPQRSARVPFARTEGHVKVAAGLLAITIVACGGSSGPSGPTGSPPPPASPSPIPLPSPTPSPDPSPTAGGGLSLSCQANPRSGTVPLQVAFTSFPSGATGSYLFDWSFGDGGSSTNPN